MLQNHLGLSSVQYGWVTLTLTGTILLAKLINTFALNYFTIERLKGLFWWAVRDRTPASNMLGQAL